MKGVMYVVHVQVCVCGLGGGSVADCERLCLLQKSCAAATDGHRGLVVIQSGRTETGGGRTTR